MDLLAFLAEFGGWSWVVGGVVLLAIELIAPGGVFVWLGAAAIVTGIIALLGLVNPGFQWVLFGGLSLAAIAGWVKIARSQKLPPSDSPLLNQRAAKLVGLHATLREPIENGFGRVNIGDSSWRASGPDLPAGTEVRIIGFQGAVLMVEAVH